MVLAVMPGPSEAVAPPLVFDGPDAPAPVDPGAVPAPVPVTPPVEDVPGTAPEPVGADPVAPGTVRAWSPEPGVVPVVPVTS